MGQALTRSPRAAGERSTATLLYLVYFIYFFCGMTQCFEGVFLPEFKEYFQLGYQQQMYTLFAKNVPFLLAAVIGCLVARLGYKNCLTAAMLLYAAGTFLLVPGLAARRYEVVLAGFFLIGAGFNFQIVAGNPLLAALGPARDSSSRLNLGNALGALAQVIAPASLSVIIPAGVVTMAGKLPYMNGLFAALGVALCLIAAATALARPVNSWEPFQSPGTAAVSLWRHPRLLFGFAAIFFVLGAEAGLFGLYRNFLEDPNIAGLGSHASQRLFAVYFSVFALGRLAASWIQKRIQPAAHLVFNGLAAGLCLATAILTRGCAAVAAVTAAGFFVSIFFPTLYSLAIQGMGDRTGQASGLLTMGFLGCAVLPVLQGRLADRFGLQPSYIVGVVAYLLAVLYALRASPGRKRA